MSAGDQMEDVHIEGKHCYVKVLGKGQKERIVYVGRRTHEALLTYRTFVRPRHAKNVTVTSFFLSQEGRTLTLGAIQQMMRDLGQAAGVPRLHPHLLRHTSATQYLVNGGCHQPAAQAGARRAGDDQPLRTFCLGGAGRDPGAGGAHGQA